MNKQCNQCGHVMLVPDIPLPPGYTQKCIACGTLNVVSDNYPDTEIEGTPHNDFGSDVDPSDIIDFSMSNMSESQNGVELSDPAISFSSGPQQNIQVPSDQIAVLTKKIEDLQHQINFLRKNEPQQSFGTIPLQDESNPNPLLKASIVEDEALFCSHQAGMANICARRLREKGITTHIVDDINHAIEKVKEMAFEYIIIDQRMLQGKQEGGTLIKLIKAITLPIRRKQIVALITPNIESAESQVFYQWGIDINIHFNDLEHLAHFLNDTREYKRELYRNYHGLTIT